MAKPNKMRNTVIITTRDNPAERRFHLSPERAQSFAAKIIAAGGTAKIIPFAMSAEQSALLVRLRICVS